ncbi:GNAT family N-acetyltransferase [Arcicella rigui]|uniref:GNAT family N-acetyltransferase n=1 Tax=Arcicella rigui TaxID=797020 RepID=A0ABU5Q6L8_9BACT|nr:GNAT family N-acetyltransferase [Arcicella rigui]MEA5138287.1 GNAT family N-acetyltransferase [Arcicella rigui]
MQKIIETERLILREYNFKDTQFIIQLLNSEGWLAFIGDKNVHTEEDAQSYLLNGPMKSYAENGYGLCAIIRKEDLTPIGMSGLIKRDNLDFPDIGFAFLPEFMGQGYGFEIADAILTHAKDTLKIPTVYGIVMAENIGSRKLLEKIGLRVIGDYTFPSKDENLLLLKIDF